MKAIISKELLSEVLGEDIENIQSKLILNNQVMEYSIRRGQKVNFINIHEVAHMCKEWARSTNNEITPYKTIYDKPYEAHVNQSWDCDNNGSEPYSVSDYKCMADSEPEAIIKATQWLKQNSH